LSPVVVVSSLKDHYVVPVYEIDESVLFVYASGPAPGKDMAQGLWLPDPAGWVAKDVLNESVEPLECRPVPALPEGVVIPPVRREDQAHYRSS